MLSIYLFQKKSKLALVRKNRAASNPTLCIPAAIEIHECRCTESVCQLVCTGTVLCTLTSITRHCQWKGRQVQKIQFYLYWHYLYVPEWTVCYLLINMYICTEPLKGQYFFSFPRNIISFPRNNISFPLNNISFPRNIISFPRNIISFPRNIISFPRNIIPSKSFRFLEIISFPWNNLAGTEPLICHLIYWDMKTISEVAVIKEPLARPRAQFHRAV